MWRCGIDQAAAEDAYAALLVAQHARWLYTHFGQDTIEDRALAQKLTNELAMRIDTSIRNLSSGSNPERSAVEPRNLATASRLLSFFDQWSLVLIGALPDLESDLALPYAQTTANLSIQRCGDDVSIEPWPFENGPWTLTTMATRLRQSNFADPDALLQSIAAEPCTDLTWSIRPR